MAITLMPDGPEDGRLPVAAPATGAPSPILFSDDTDVEGGTPVLQAVRTKHMALQARNRLREGDPATSWQA